MEAAADTGGAGPLRVAMLTTSFPRYPGDFAGHFVAELAEALSARGHTVEVVAPHAPGLDAAESWEVPGAAPIQVTRFRYAPDTLERVAYGDGIPSNVKRDPRALAALPAFGRALKRVAAEASRRSDVVHAHWAPTAALAASDAMVAPVVVTLHGSDVALAERGGLWRRLLERGLARPTVAVIAVSDDLAARLRASLPDTKLPPLTVIPTGVESALLERARPDREPDEPVTIAYVGRLLESKGVLDLADAMASLAPDLRLVVAGDGPAREAMAASLARRGIADDCVSWLGALPHDEALDVMAKADIVVVPSHAEGAGLVALEASALGTCVIATRTGIMPAVLDNEQLVEPRDPASLGAALLHLSTDRDERRRLAAAARDRVAAQYTWDVLVAHVESVYREAIERGAAR
jgi:glycosyltransferase involved in cell wall biosynthesis